MLEGGEELSRRTPFDKLALREKAHVLCKSSGNRINGVTSNITREISPAERSPATIFRGAMTPVPGEGHRADAVQ
jgi:hypothetical protein